MTIKKLTGTDPNQIPLNRDLGTLAYQDAKFPQLGVPSIQSGGVNGSSSGACRHYIAYVELATGTVSSQAQPLFYSDNNMNFKITYCGHNYNGGNNSSSMMRYCEFYGAIGSGGAGETNVDWWVANGVNLGAADGAPSFDTTSNYFTMYYGAGVYMSYRHLKIETFGDIPMWHPSLNIQTA